LASAAHRAIDTGVNLFDTSDAYSTGKNEQLLARAIMGRREN
jgi:aryl-alcohol dehydrogenase-like predicted oxidoreductase